MFKALKYFSVFVGVIFQVIFNLAAEEDPAEIATAEEDRQLKLWEDQLREQSKRDDRYTQFTGRES